ncbi:MAG: transposase [Bryobacterales bacterium]|nr:transposase [Bryobacterales bacterium]
MTLVLDNPGTHKIGSLCDAFEPERAAALAQRIEFCFTPKHGSWLNVAECELIAMIRQCLKGRRIGDIKTLREELAAWATNINSRQRGVDWQVTVNDARCKVKSVYPKIVV